MAILRAPTGFYTWARSDLWTRLLARLADRTSLSVIDNDNLRRSSSVQAATITICRVRAGLYVPTCTGWLTPMPPLQWHVPQMRPESARTKQKSITKSNMIQARDAQPHKHTSETMSVKESQEVNGAIADRRGTLATSKWEDIQYSEGSATGQEDTFPSAGAMLPVSDELLLTSSSQEAPRLEAPRYTHTRDNIDKSENITFGRGKPPGLRHLRYSCMLCTCCHSN